MGNLQLKNVTLYSYNCVDPIQSVKALVYSSRQIDFAKAILISNQKPEKIPSWIEFVYVQNTCKEDSSRFTYTTLPDLIHTDYCLGIHDDGFVINPHLWDNNFFNYDYIGAPWKADCGHHRVGNGGFVFRSNRFVQLTRNLRYNNGHDDGELCLLYRNYFLRNECKYAPVEVAMKFSLESYIPECPYNLEGCFGFHGRGIPSWTHVHNGHYQMFQDKCKLLESVIL